VSVKIRKRARIPLALTALSGLLIATVLYQRPVAEFYPGSSTGSGFLVHSWDLAWLLLLVVAIVVLVSSRIGPLVDALRGYLNWRDPWVWMLLLAVYAPISLIWSYANFGQSGLSSSAAECLHLLAMAILATLIRLVLRGSDRDALVWMFVTAATASAVWAILAWSLETTTLSNGVRTLQYGVTRAGGPFGNEFSSGTSDGWWVASGASNALGFWLAACLPVCLLSGLRIRSAQPRLGWALLVAVPVVVAGLLATHSRESWLAAFIATCIGAALLTPQFSGRQKLVAFGIMLAALALVAFGIPSVRARLEHTFTPGSFDYRTGPVARTTAWSHGLKWAEERFPLGWGIGAIEYHPASFGGANTAENVFLQYFAQLGLPGFVGLTALVLTGLRCGVLMIRRSTSDLPGLFITAFFAALIVHGMFGNTLGDPTIQILLGCAIGLCATHGRSESGGLAAAPT
jgi:hypothetical protein